MAEKVRIAIIGFGGMGRIYAQMLQAGMVPNMVLTGVCCRNPEGKQLLGEKFPGVAVYEDADDMAAHQDEFDAVLIATPHTSHVPIGIQFAKLGKHILMDKPAGIVAGEVEALARHCDDQGLAFSMIFHNRLIPAFKTLKEKLNSGILGTLHRAVWVCNDWYRSPAYHQSAGWRSSWAGECGGMMVNQNPHYLDIWNWLFGLPDRVYADMEFGRYNDFLVDDAIDLQLYYDTGFHGTFVSATGETPGINRLEIWGTKGRLTLEGNRITFAENEMDTETFGKENKQPFGRIPFTIREEELEGPGNPYGVVFQNFADHICSGIPLFTTGWDGFREVQLANAVYVSGWSEKKVRLPVKDAEFVDGLVIRQELERNRN